MKYLLHRFVIHGVQPFKSWHREHHERPNALICLPTVLSAALILILVFPYFVNIRNIACLRTDLRYSNWLFGIYNHPSWDSSLAYDSNWLRKRKRWHGLHHHVNQASYFGVTNSFWDYVFVRVLHI